MVIWEWPLSDEIYWLALGWMVAVLALLVWTYWIGKKKKGGYNESPKRNR